MPVESGKLPEPHILSSSAKETREQLEYTHADIAHIEKWVKRHCETTWHSLGTCSMAPKESNSIVKNGVLDERLDVHGVKKLKVVDLSICPDNVGRNTFSGSIHLLNHQLHSMYYVFRANLAVTRPIYWSERRFRCWWRRTWATLEMR